MKCTSTARQPRNIGPPQKRENRRLGGGEKRDWENAGKEFRGAKGLCNAVRLGHFVRKEEAIWSWGTRDGGATTWSLECR